MYSRPAAWSGIASIILFFFDKGKNHTVFIYLLIYSLNEGVSIEQAWYMQHWMSLDDISKYTVVTRWVRMLGLANNSNIFDRFPAKTGSTRKASTPEQALAGFLI
jgi:hypothetical protein